MTTESAPRILGAICWLLLIAVMFGGESLIRLMSSGDLEGHQQQFFRAGHGHAGVLSIAGLLFSMYLGETSLSPTLMIASWAAYAVGVFMIAGGMFLHAYRGEAGTMSVGVTISMVGGVVLASSVVFLAWHLFRSPA